MGEPLTHPQLPEFIQMAGAQGYKSIVTTNGTLLEKRGEELLESPFTTVQIHREILKAQGTCGNIGVKKSTPQKGKAPFCKKLRRREECV